MVPELAGRSHLEQITSLTRNILSEVALDSIDLIAATSGPGLVGSLLVGVQYARGISFAQEVPFRGIHHIEAHIWSAEIESGELPLPHLALVVSGGHTLLVLVRGIRDYRILGETQDDAMGEAYDKAGKLMGFGYPAGAAVDKSASQGTAGRFALTVPMRGEGSDFSFSGLKTALLYKFRTIDAAQSETAIPDLLASFQYAAVESVIHKIENCLREHSVCAMTASGGAAANSLLNFRLNETANAHGIPFRSPTLKLCSDNAAMIGYLACKLESAGIIDEISHVVRPRWPISQLTARTSRITTG